jgi:hypothetical protein
MFNNQPNKTNWQALPNGPIQDDQSRIFSSVKINDKMAQLPQGISFVTKKLGQNLSYKEMNLR